MAGRQSRTLTEVELEFMHAVWAGGEVTPQDVMEILRKQGRDLSDGTVRKVLSILARKGYVSRKRKGRGFAYKARVAEEDAGKSMVKDMVQRMFGGSATLMVSSLFDAREVSAKEVREIKRLIAEREKEGQ